MMDDEIRTVDQINDAEWQEYRIERVESPTTADGCYEIGFDGSAVIAQSFPRLGPPSVGDTLRLYGRGFGYPFRGVAVNGRVEWYRTPDEQKAEQDRWRAEHAAKKQARFAAKRAEIEAGIARLPESLRQRIARLRGAPDAWDEAEWLEYEAFVCGQAAAIAAALPTEAQIDAWKDLDWGTQRQQVPRFSEEHSGYTFAASVALAKMLLRGDVV